MTPMSQLDYERALRLARKVVASDPHGHEQYDVSRPTNMRLLAEAVLRQAAELDEIDALTYALEVVP